MGLEILLPDVFLSYSFKVHVNAWIKTYIYKAAKAQSFETLKRVIIFKGNRVIFSFTKGERLPKNVMR